MLRYSMLALPCLLLLPFTSLANDMPSYEELARMSSVDLDLSKLHDDIKNESQAQLSVKHTPDVTVPQSVVNDEFIAKLNFGLGSLDKSLEKEGDENDIVAIKQSPIPSIKILLLPKNQYRVIKKLKRGMDMLPSTDGLYAYKILPGNKAELTFVPESGVQKGVAFKVILDFDKPDSGKLDAKMFHNLSGSIPMPVNFNKLMYVTEQPGIFKLENNPVNQTPANNNNIPNTNANAPGGLNEHEAFDYLDHTSD